MVRSGPGSPRLKFSGRHSNYSTIQTGKNLPLREITALNRTLTSVCGALERVLSQHADLNPGRGTNST